MLWTTATPRALANALATLCRTFGSDAGSGHRLDHVAAMTGMDAKCNAMYTAIATTSEIDRSSDVQARPATDQAAAFGQMPGRR